METASTLLAFSGRSQPVAQTRPAEAIKAAAELGLKHDSRCDDEHREPVLYEKVNDREIKDATEQDRKQYQCEAPTEGSHWRGCRSAA